MADHTLSMACAPQKSEPSLISPHIHSHDSRKRGDGVGKDTAVCSKSFTVGENNEQYNGCVSTDTDFAFSKNTVQNQNVINCTNFEGACIECHHSSVCCDPHFAVKTKCLERVNGLAPYDTVTEHSSGDNPFLVNLLNAHKIEALELNQSYDVDSHQGSECVCRLNQTSREYIECDAACDEIEIVKLKAKKGSPEFHGSRPTNHSNDVETLITKLDKTSLCHHSNSSDLSMAPHDVLSRVTYVVYESEKQMPDIMRLITKDLSEPYSIYTYRYFIHNWPKLCFLAIADNKYVGAIVCKLDLHKKMVRRGYIAMLAVDSEYRRRQIGSTLVTKAIEAMIRDDCDEVVLETEITNQGALHLYENLGFVRDKRLFRYYLNGVDALRLKLWLR